MNPDQRHQAELAVAAGLAHTLRTQPDAPAGTEVVHGQAQDLMPDGTVFIHAVVEARTPGKHPIRLIVQVLDEPSMIVDADDLPGGVR